MSMKNYAKTELSIISHRGASGYLPEHSLPAYSLAIDLASDYIEPDLVLSKDGVFFAMHDVLLDQTTNIASLSQFRNRTTMKTVDGENVTGYFVDDFTSLELKLLRLKQRLPVHRTTIFDNIFQIPTLTDIFNLVSSRKIDNQLQKQIGIYVEIKHPTYFRTKGHNVEDMLLKEIQSNGYAIIGVDRAFTPGVTAPIVIQCFEADSLISLRRMCDLPLVQLLGQTGDSGDVTDIWSADSLDLIAKYASGVGPPATIFLSNPLNYSRSNDMLDMARDRALAVHPWTFRAEREYVSPVFNGSSERESLYFVCCLRTQGMFTEFPDQTREHIAVAAADPCSCSELCPEKFATPSGVYCPLPSTSSSSGRDATSGNVTGNTGTCSVLGSESAASAALLFLLTLILLLSVLQYAQTRRRVGAESRQASSTAGDLDGGGGVSVLRASGAGDDASPLRNTTNPMLTEDLSTIEPGGVAATRVVIGTGAVGNREEYRLVSQST